MHEIALLRDLADEHTVPASDEVRAAQRSRLEQHIERRRHRRPGRRAWLVPAAGLAATTLVAAAVFVDLHSGGRSASAAATELRRAAAVAAERAAPRPLKVGQYHYTRSVNAYLSTSVYGSNSSFSVLVPHLREIWLGPSGGRLVQRSGKAQFLSARDRQAWIAAGRPSLAERAHRTSLPPPPALDLTSDPDALYERLEADARGHGEGLHEEMFVLAGDALRETGATPAQRAALYEVAARIPGVELVGRVVDSAGRSGIAVAYSSDADHQRHMLIIDPQTSVLLGEKYVALEGGEFPAGTVVGSATYLVEGVVNSLSERP
ncbi:MAG: CU044_5270 family protein [Gaiellaceae bacterium]